MTPTIDSADAVIRSDRRGRVLVSAEQREALLDEFERSGLSGMAFCRMHSLTYPTFASWVQKRRQRPDPGLPAFAEVTRGPLRVLLSGPKSSGGRPLPNGEVPAPGGWNRIHLVVEDIAAEIERLTALGVCFRSEIVSGPGGQQAVFDDPAGNPIELFQPAR